MYQDLHRLPVEKEIDVLTMNSPGNVHIQEGQNCHDSTEDSRKNGFGRRRPPRETLKVRALTLGRVRER